MTRSKAITEKQVWDTADELVANGNNNPSQRDIIKEIGGSAGTVGPYLDSWKKDKDHRDSLQSVEVPPVLLEKNALFMAEIWRKAEELAGVENQAMREQILRLKSEMENAASDYQKRISDLELEAEEAAATAAAELKASQETAAAEAEKMQASNTALVAENSEQAALIITQKEEIARLQGEAANMSKLEEMFAKFMQANGEK